MNTLLRIIAINLLFLPQVWAVDRGIYLTQNSLENTSRVKDFIARSKETGINTFVIDLKHIRSKYDRNIKLVKDAGIKYVARIVIFPGGGNKAEIKSIAIRQNRLQLMKHAESLGVDEIQLDYIRYNTKVPKSSQNPWDILAVIKWFKSRTSVPIQVAVFGETAYGPSMHIGQDLLLFSDYVNTIAPMLYPSHFEPKQIHSYQPYATIKKSLDALIAQFNGRIHNDVVTYIETSNYRRKMNYQTKFDYIRAQLEAVKDAGLDGWYAWSANNQYNTLFNVLKSLH